MKTILLEWKAPRLMQWVLFVAACSIAFYVGRTSGDEERVVVDCVKKHWWSVGRNVSCVNVSPVSLEESHARLQEAFSAEERHILEVFERRLRGPSLPDEIVVDVGASGGAFALLAARRGFRVLAFESHRKCIDILAAATAMHNVEGQICVIQRPISDVNGREIIQSVTGAKCTGGHKGQQESTSGLTETLETLTLDAAIAGGVTVRCLKMALQGYEVFALVGARELFRTKRIQQAIVNSHSWAEGCVDIKECMARIAFLFEDGYCIRCLKGGQAGKEWGTRKDWMGAFPALSSGNQFQCIDLEIFLCPRSKKEEDLASSQKSSKNGLIVVINTESERRLWYHIRDVLQTGPYPVTRVGCTPTSPELKTFQWKPHPKGPVHAAITCSHYLAVLEAHKMGSDFVMILEDDAQLVPSFWAEFEKRLALVGDAFGTMWLAHFAQREMLNPKTGPVLGGGVLKKFQCHNLWSIRGGSFLGGRSNETNCFVYNAGGYVLSRKAIKTIVKEGPAVLDQRLSEHMVQHPAFLHGGYFTIPPLVYHCNMRASHTTPNKKGHNQKMNLQDRSLEYYRKLGLKIPTWMSHECPLQDRPPPPTPPPPQMPKKQGK